MKEQPQPSQANSPQEPTRIPTQTGALLPTPPEVTQNGNRDRGRHRPERNPEIMAAKRKKRRRIVAGASAIILAATGIFGGISLKKSSHDSPRQPLSISTPNVTNTDPNINMGPPIPIPKPKPSDLTTTIVVKPGDSEWKISEASLKAATGKKPSAAAINAITIVNAEINMKNGYANNPDLIHPGQRLEILSKDAITHVSDSANDPSIYPELTSEINKLNSQSGSIEDAAQTETATIQTIEKDLAEQLGTTPIFDQTTSDLQLQSYSSEAFSFDALWVNPEQSIDADANDSAIPSREISKLRKRSAEPEVVFSSITKFSRQNLVLAA